MLSSERLLLRKVEMEDTELYHSWRNNMDVMYSTNPSLDLYTLEDTRSFVENSLVNSNTSKSYMLIQKEDEVAIGITSLINIDYKNRNAECIIDIGETSYWGKGYGTEALKLLLDYAFLELNLHRVYLRVFSFNHKAIKLYKKIGFIEEGISRQCLFRNGKWEDIVHMGVLYNEYLNNNTE